MRATKGAGVFDRVHSGVPLETAGESAVHVPVSASPRPTPKPESTAAFEETGSTTAPISLHSGEVDENTGSRQRITLFGRKRKGPPVAPKADTQDAVDDGSALLADLVRETADTVAEPATDEAGAPEWIVDRILEADEREQALAEVTVPGIDEETAERATITREPERATAESVPASTETRELPKARRAATTRVFPPARPAPDISAPVVLSVNGLHKRYGNVVAVDGVSLNVRAGSLYGIVGPNGAGKTTTLSIITGLLRPDAGSVYVNGVDARKHPRAAKRAIGVLPDHLRTFDRLTGAQFLFYAGTLRGLDAGTTRKRSADLAAAFGIEDAMGRLVADYSAGMTKKVSLAAAMIHSPRLLVLDEPFEAVDPVSAATVTGILQRYVDAGGTVLLSSHGMDLVQRICDSVAIIIGGVVLDAGPVDDVRGEKTLEDHFVELAGGRKAAEGLEWLHSFSD